MATAPPTVPSASELESLDQYDKSTPVVDSTSIASESQLLPQTNTTNNQSSCAHEFKLLSQAVQLMANVFHNQLSKGEFQLSEAMETEEIEAPSTDEPIQEFSVQQKETEAKSKPWWCLW